MFMEKTEDSSYIDAKGRTRWRRNDTLAAELKQLGDFLIISGYEESHATRYARLAHTISRYPESLERLHQEERLTDVPGVGGTIAAYIAEYLETGTCAKREEWVRETPLSVLELTAIPGLGAKTVRALYREHGIDSLAALEAALNSGVLDAADGIGPKTRETMRRHIAGQPPRQATPPDGTAARRRAPAAPPPPPRRPKGA